MLIRTDILGSFLHFSELVIREPHVSGVSGEKKDLERNIVKGEGERDGISQQLGLQVQG